MKLSKNAIINTHDYAETCFNDGQWLGILIGGLVASVTFLIMSV